LHNTFSSVQVSFSVVSNSLQPHGLQHSRLPCILPTPKILREGSKCLVSLLNVLLPGLHEISARILFPKPGTAKCKRYLYRPCLLQEKSHSLISYPPTKIIILDIYPDDDSKEHAKLKGSEEDLAFSSVLLSEWVFHIEAS